MGSGEGSSVGGNQMQVTAASEHQALVGTVLSMLWSEPRGALMQPGGGAQDGVGSQQGPSRGCCLGS